MDMKEKVEAELSRKENYFFELLNTVKNYAYQQDEDGPLVSYVKFEFFWDGVLSMIPMELIFYDEQFGEVFPDIIVPDSFLRTPLISSDEVEDISIPEFEEALKEKLPKLFLRLWRRLDCHLLPFTGLLYFHDEAKILNLNTEEWERW